MNDRNETIIDADIKKADALCPDSLALIGVYGSVATGDEYGKSDLDLMILINDENGQVLADGFIIDDVDIGYDLYCTSWDMLENDAQCCHAHLSRLFDSMIDRQFGWVPAILVSGAMFSLYHLGYPGFRTWEDILLLFAVGVGFAAAYKISGNNLIVSFFVNLPNAFVTYILKYEQFPVMRVSSTIAAAVTLVFIGLILLLYRNADQRRQ